MPNIITHTLFFDELYDSFDSSYLEWMDSRKQLMEIGSNGPDFLFFHCFSPERILKRTKLRTLGNVVHHSKVNEFYKMAVYLIRNEKNEEIKKDMMAYVCGHLCHWALDSQVHPYVFYRTGTCKGESAWWHHRFESILDALVLKAQKGITIQEYKAGKICDVSKEMARAIAKIYVPIAKEVYGVDIKPHEILESLNDWKFMQSVFYDPTGSKYKMAHSIEKLVDKDNIFSGYFVPNTAHDPYDTCNLMHKEWLHPCDDSIKSTDSFFDLYAKALNSARIVIDLFLEAIEDESKVDEFTSFLADRNYDTGLSEDKKMKYFDLIW